MADAGGVRNVVSGSVAGSVVQAGKIHQVVVSTQAPEARLVPRQLPPVVRDFSGRVDQIAALDAVLRDAQAVAHGSVLVVALDGTAGVGKTTLAVWWAHRMQSHFPDGTLFVNLRGYGPSAPLEPRLVLAGFLSALGVADERIPAEVEQQSVLYRSLMAERTMLVMLDNAGSAEQVRPLLAGAVGSLVLVTSRASLTGLAVTEAAGQITLDLFDPDEAFTLVAGILGAQRADTERAAVDELIRVCARLPLALRIAATRIASRRFVEVADVVEEIRCEQRGLAVLSGSSDEPSAVRTVFDWSYARLPAEQARLFRLLGLHPSPEFGVHAAAAVGGVDLRAAQMLLEAMADQHMIEAVGRQRYRLHDLLQAYAAHRAELDDIPLIRQEAVSRLLTWYAATAEVADRLVFPATVGLAVELGQAAVPAPVAKRSQALEWLHVEQDTLAAAQQAALEQGLHPVVLALAVAARHLTRGRRAWWPERLEAESRGLLAARACGDRVAEAFLLSRRGNTHCMMGDYESARTDFTGVLAVAEELEDPVRGRKALCGLGSIDRDLQRYAEAWDYYQAALPLAQATGDPLAEAVVVCNLSQISAAVGRFDSALTYAERELELRTEVGVALGVAYAQHDVAVARQGMGEHAVAVELCERAAAIYAEQEGMQAEWAGILETLAASLVYIGQTVRAVDCLREAAAVLADLGEPRAEEVRRRADDLAGQ